MREVFRSGQNLLTPHPPERYPGHLVVKPGPEWEVWVIVPEPGATLLAHGGEKTYAYETVDGGHAQGFELRAGDRARLARTGLPFAFAEFEIERAAPA